MDELTALAAGTSNVSDDDVLLWLDFAGLGDSRATLNAAIAQAEPLAEADCTPESWSAFAAAKTSAKAMNAKYTTTDNLNDAAAALNAARETLVLAQAPHIDTSLLQTACQKAGTLSLDAFKDDTKPPLPQRKPPPMPNWLRPARRRKSTPKQPPSIAHCSLCAAPRTMRCWTDFLYDSMTDTSKIHTGRSFQ